MTRDQERERELRAVSAVLSAVYEHVRHVQSLAARYESAYHLIGAATILLVAAGEDIDERLQDVLETAIRR